MPKIDVQPWTNHTSAPHPYSGQDDGPYASQTLGDLVGLTQFGVQLERLPPGSRSSHRHWHETEDEFVYVLSGELVLVEDVESKLTAGEAAGWKAGQTMAHCLENRSSRDAVLLIVGTRSDRDAVHYPDHGLILHRDGAQRRFTNTAGAPIETDD